MSDIKIKLAAGTNVGLVRTNNEDNFVASRDLTASDWTIPQVDEEIDLGKYGALLVVADGMGGANAGEVASAIAIETIQTEFASENLENAVRSETAIKLFMEDAVKKADLNIYNRSIADEKTQGMGTTIVLCWILGNKAHVCWCGDSRCYVFNEKVGLTRLSKDHSYVQELVDKGELSPENAHNHPYSNVITRCLGDMQHRAVPDSRVYHINDGDIFMLCSDGLCGLCIDDEITNVMMQHKDNINDCKNELISAALNAGGYDNVTVVMGAVEMEQEQTAEDADAEAEESEANVSDNKDDIENTRIPVVHHSHTGRDILLFLLALMVAVAAIYLFKPELFEPIMGTSDAQQEKTVLPESKKAGQHIVPATTDSTDTVMTMNKAEQPADSVMNN